MKKIELLVAFMVFVFLMSSCKNKQEEIAEKFKSESDYGQYAPNDAYVEDSNYAYYGSENEWNRRMFSDKAIGKYYKRQGQREMLSILDGKLDSAILVCRKTLDKEPNDLESLFNLSIIYAQKEKLDSALFYMNSALKHGLPFTRYLAGPRTLLTNLYATNEFKELKKLKNIKLIHGPMKAAVNDNTVKIWMRTAETSNVLIRLYKKNGKKFVKKFSGKSTPEADYTCVIELKGLNPGEKYLYDIFIDGKKVSTDNSLSSFADLYNRTIKVGFGGGAGYTPAHERIWDTLATYNFEAFLFLGDNVYIDDPGMPGPFHDYTYYRRQSRPEFRRFLLTTNTYAIWDDHDAGMDDIWMGPTIDKPAWKLPMLKHFERQWVNPKYGIKEEPGCYFKFSIGRIDFFMMDCRTYRTNPFKEEKTMIGPIQKKWLFDALKKSTAIFKVIVSSVPWSYDAKLKSHDTWAGYKNERTEIFDFLTDNKIDGVILLSADRHRSDAWKITRPNDYDLYEFESSRLTNIHTHELMPGSIIAYNEKCSFGELIFDLSQDDPKVTFIIHSIDNENKGKVVVKLSDLK